MDKVELDADALAEFLEPLVEGDIAKRWANAILEHFAPQGELQKKYDDLDVWSDGLIELNHMNLKRIALLETAGHVKDQALMNLLACIEQDIGIQEDDIQQAREALAPSTEGENDGPPH